MAIFSSTLDVLNAQENQSSPNISSPKPETDLWDRDALPEGAIARYGATDRNPYAVGVLGLRYSNDGRLLAIRDQRQQIRILDFEKRELQAVLPTVSHRDFVFTPDDQLIAVGDRRSIRFWDIKAKEEVRQIDHPGFHLASNSDRQNFSVAGRDEVIRYSWPLPSEPKRFDTEMVSGTIVPVGLSRDGRLALFHNMRHSELLDTNTGKPVPKTAIKGYQKAVFSTDSKQMVAFNPGLTQLAFFDLRNAKRYHYTISDRQRFSTAAFSNDGRFLYTGNFANQIVVWDLLTRTEIDRIEGHGARVMAIAASPTGLLRLVSGASAIHDRSVIFWDLRSRLFPEQKLIGEVDWDRLWEDLGREDSATSLDATRRLIQILQDDSAAYETLETMMELVKSEGNVNDLVSQLDDAKYLAREEASAKLRSMLGEIRPELERHLEDASPEAKWRIRRILEAVTAQPAFLTAESRRAARTVFVLELLATSEAKETLELISQLSGQHVAVEESLAALGRLSQ